MTMTAHAIKTWFEKAVPNPTDTNRNVQYGVHLEEKAEEFAAIGETALAERMAQISRSFKQGEARLDPAKIDRVELLDALCDQIVTAIGVAHSQGMNILGALAEVNRSNYSKFVNGQPVFDANGKIAKGPHYSKPDLSRFV